MPVLTLRDGSCLVLRRIGRMSVYSSPNVCFPRPNVKRRYAARTTRSTIICRWASHRVPARSVFLLHHRRLTSSRANKFGDKISQPGYLSRIALIRPHYIVSVDISICGRSRGLRTDLGLRRSVGLESVVRVRRCCSCQRLRRSRVRNVGRDSSCAIHVAGGLRGK